MKKFLFIPIFILAILSTSIGQECGFVTNKYSGNNNAFSNCFHQENNVDRKNALENLLAGFTLKLEPGEELDKCSKNNDLCLYGKICTEYAFDSEGMLENLITEVVCANEVPKIRFVYNGTTGTTYDMVVRCMCMPRVGEIRKTSNRLGNSFTTGILKKEGNNNIISLSRFNEGSGRPWFKTYGSTGYNTGLGIATDIIGNNITTGAMSNSVDFDTETFSSLGERDIFIVKNDAEGNELWAKRAGSDARDEGLDVAVDNAGNSYVVGYYKAAADFDGITLAHSGTEANGFIAKYNSNGIIQWATAIGGSDNNVVNAVAVSDDGTQVYITGHFAGTADFGTQSLTANNETSLFLAKIATDGSVAWAKKYEQDTPTAGRTLITDPAGNIILAGTENDQMLILKYAANGTLLKTKNAASTGTYLRLNDITTSSTSGNIQVIGHFTGDILLDGQIMDNLGSQDIFMAELNANLDVVWAKSEGGTSLDYGISLDNNAMGYTSYVGCSFGTSTINDITQEGDNIIYYRRFDDAGQTSSALESIPGLNLTVAPNPFTQSIDIDLSMKNPEGLTIEIFDPVGKRVYQDIYEASQGDNKISLGIGEKLSKGLYFLRIGNEQGQFTTEKIVKL